MTQQLDVFKFSDNRESEVNQEELEKVKKEIDEHKKRKKENDREAGKDLLKLRHSHVKYIYIYKDIPFRTHKCCSSKYQRCIDRDAFETSRS